VLGSRKRFSVIFPALILISVSLFAITAGLLRARPTRYVVLRVDDIQDFAFRDAQLLLLNYSIDTDLVLSLGVVSGMFGEDFEILDAVRFAVGSGSEVGIHGWRHEDLAVLSFTEQRDILFQAKSRIRQLLDVDARLLIPPMFSYNDDTISAMCEESCSIISTCGDFDEPGFSSEVKNIPATVELSILSDGVWQMKSAEVVVGEVERSFELFGYAAIVTHPQEFVRDGELNQVNLESFVNLVENLGSNCEFTTFEKLSQSR